MSKIICDVCGTKYPESAEQCPICGRVADAGTKTVADSFVMDDAEVESRPKVRGGRFSKSNVRKRNKNMSYYEEEEDRPEEEPVEDEYEDMEPQGKSGVVLNVLLVIVIIALLCVTGYILMEFLLPNVLPSETVPPTDPYVETTVPVEETEEPTIPCEELTLQDDYSAKLEIGGYTLLNVEVFPADTTDELVFASSDEAVLAVNSDGRVTAIGEGQAVVTITCGPKTLECYISCVAAEETEATETTGETEESPEETEEATEAPTEAPTEPEGPTEPLKDVTLKVNLTDITFNAKGQGYTFKVDGLDNTEVKWISQDESIVTIDENGKAISVGKGRTTIICKYGDQEVEIIVRCTFG